MSQTYLNRALLNIEVAPEMEIREPGTFVGVFRGSNADTAYTVSYTVTVHPAQ